MTGPGHDIKTAQELEKEFLTATGVVEELSAELKDAREKRNATPEGTRCKDLASDASAARKIARRLWQALDDTRNDRASDDPKVMTIRYKESALV